ncbi:Lon protease family protein [Serpentinicella alkaliphila]|uniref:endopeptidase La n=1 Tax=Serpentinicella alkaliphila TaxID=1734049 RepID=A0A4R2TUN3_9FIRM|nr:ATP-binding protein [Serpentinicella alkaliphila]QUH25674.1 AAA family ATPase [Serpentinicella alkaliphila]TCQ06612.1 lon-related putative ATP-dependent protease [Serpentinicella alkaliphila]
MNKFRLEENQLTSSCPVSSFDFKTTADLEPLNGIIGQDRAVDALQFGLSIDKKGYNIYISGLTGTGRSSYAKSITQSRAEQVEIPSDYIYVCNFKQPDKPYAIRMRTGQGASFKNDLELAIEQLGEEIPDKFEGTEYETNKANIFKHYQSQIMELKRKLNEIAMSYRFVFKETEQGLVTLPLKDNKIMTQEDYNSLTHEEIEELKSNSEKLNIITIDFLTQLRNIEEESKATIQALDENIGRDVVNIKIEHLVNKYKDNESIVKYLQELTEDIINHINYFKYDNEKTDAEKLMLQIKKEEEFFSRYKVNLFVNNDELKHAPIIYETNPTYYNLFGSIEYRNEMGVLRTDFTQIKPGSIHMANGGFLVIQIKDILSQPYSWETLKRVLITGMSNIENINSKGGYVVTSTLKPQSIPIKLKVILVGDAYIYQMLYNLDEDYRKLFKIMADFDVEMDRNDENILKMAQFIATHCKEVNLLEFDKSAICKVIEFSSRLAGHKNKLSSQFNQIVEILYEADAWAKLENAKIITEKYVQKAIKQKVYRNSKYEEKLNEMYEEETLLIDVEGQKIGQINGLAVMGTGQHQFGKPNRITVSTYKGKAGIISIEREVEKSGSIHDKGVLILSGYLGQKYAQEEALSLTVSISFEQNYSLIDGDSASSTELYAILSSIAQVPIDQGIAVTGSINQKGEIQPIGGVNEKIEGFFDICKIKGFNGKQGVIIPKQNVSNLMLKEEVIDAVRKGEFHIYAVGHVDEGIEILTKMPAGEKNKRGQYPKGTLNYLIQKRLKNLVKTNKKEEEKEID